jgi:hypothetical protein
MAFISRSTAFVAQYFSSAIAKTSANVVLVSVVSAATAANAAVHSTQNPAIEDSKSPEVTMQNSGQDAVPPYLHAASNKCARRGVP